MIEILVKQNERLRSFQQHDQRCGGLSISLEADEDEGLESQSSTGWLSLSEFFLSWGENLIQPTSPSFSTQGADGTARQPHGIKTRGCFSAAPSTNIYPRPCDFFVKVPAWFCVMSLHLHIVTQLDGQSVVVKSCRSPTFCQQK